MLEQTEIRGGEEDVLGGECLWHRVSASLAVPFGRATEDGTLVKRGSSAAVLMPRTTGEAPVPRFRQGQLGCRHVDRE